MVDLREEVARVIERAILGPGGEVWQEGETEPWQWSPESIAQALAAAGLIQPLPARIRDDVETTHGQILAAVARRLAAAHLIEADEGDPDVLLAAVDEMLAFRFAGGRVPVEPKEAK